MTEIHITSYQLQLFETESKIVDQLLAKALDDNVSSKPLRKPRRLRHRQLLPKACNEKEQDHRTSPPDQERAVSESQSVLTGVSCEDGRLCLKRGHFPTDDSLSAHIDSIYTKALKCTAKIKLKKPPWLRCRGKLCKNSSCEGSSGESRADLPVCDRDSIGQTRSCEALVELQDGDCILLKEAFSNRKRKASAAGLNSHTGYNLRRSKCPRKERTVSDSVATEITRDADSPVKSAESVLLTVNDPFSGTFAKDFMNKQIYMTRSRKQFCLSNAENKKNESEGNGDALSDSRRVRKLRTLSGEASPGRNVVQENSSLQTEGRLTRSNEKPVSNMRSCGNQPDTTHTTAAGTSHLQRRQGAKMPTKQLVMRHSLRHHKRRVISRTTNLLCSSCKHGLMSRECLLCLSVKTATRQIIQKAKSRKRETKLVGQQASLNSSVKRLVKSEVLAEKLSKQNMNACQKRSSGKQTKQSLRKFVGSNTSQKSYKNKLLSKMKPQVKFTSKDKTLRSGQKKRVQTTLLGTVRTRASTKSSKNSMPRNKPQTKPTQNVHKHTKSKPTERNVQKQKENQDTARPLAKRRKLSTDKDISSKFETSKSDATEASVLEYHRHLTEQISNQDSSPTFSSTKDVFSHLCQLEERSKDFDIGVLQEVMPKRKIPTEHRSSSVSVYSSSVDHSHVGGVWKSIFSGKS